MARIALAWMLVPCSLLAAACGDGAIGSTPGPDGGGNAGSASGGAAGAGASSAGAGGSGAGNAGSSGSAGGGGGPGAPRLLLPKTALTANELGLLVNDADPQSVALADHYLKARGIPAQNVVHLTLPTGDVLSKQDFAAAKSAVDAALSPDVQALAISWTKPYRVDCMSITSAFALGFDTKHCNTTSGPCGPTAPSSYFDSDSSLPYTELGVRPAMTLAAANIEDGRALVDRGLAADDTFPSGHGWLVRTTDTARSVRWPAFLQTIEEWKHPEGLSLSYVDNATNAQSDIIENETGILFYFTGLASVGGIDTNGYLPGAVADHVTSFGGQIPTSGQMSAAAWLAAGATGSFGTVVEPCNYTNKFPDTRVLLRRYFRGASLLEAYWKSVAWPGEGIFIGEPLAKPWGSTSIELDGAKLTIRTTLLDPKKTYQLEAAEAETGPFTVVQSPISVPNHQRAAITVEPAPAPVYRLSEVP
jgi:uncharacterized protein (TIGR03790 family)